MKPRMSKPDLHQFTADASFFWVPLSECLALLLLLCQSTASVCLADQGPVVFRREPNTTLRMPSSLDNESAGSLPPTLADSGAFLDLTTLAPQPGIVPYAVNVPFWSDGAHKTRWFSVPDSNLTIGFSRDGAWAFPAGTVWIKHFELELTNGLALSSRRIETRFLVRTAQDVYGITYRWDESQTNATLVPDEGLDEDIEVHDQDGGHTQVWHYPARRECLRCHGLAPGFALGFNTPQLNRDFDHQGVITNQIAALNVAGYFSQAVSGIHTLPALASATNAAVSLEYRVRSYLAANCAACHQPGTECLAVWDARISTPTSAAGIISGRLLYPRNGDPDGRVVAPGSLDHSMLFSRLSNLDSIHMPPIATTVLNTEAVNLVADWITNGLASFQSFPDWQRTSFTGLAAADPDADPDSDGASNWLEFLTGGNPLQGGDAWKIAIWPKPGAIQISFPHVANRAYEVQWSTGPQDRNSWITLDQPDNHPFFSSTGGQTEVEDAISPVSAKYYRVRIFEP